MNSLFRGKGEATADAHVDLDFVDRFNKVEETVQENNRMLKEILALAGTAPETDEAEVAPTAAEPTPTLEGLLEVARQYEGMNETDDRQELMNQLLEVDPKVTPWCADFVDNCLGQAGFKMLNSNVAADFANYGTPCEEKPGAIAVTYSHVGIVTKPGWIIGGNQGSSKPHGGEVNEGKTSWYGKLIGFREPVPA